MKSLIPFSLALLVETSLAANADDWRPRSIYQVFTDRYVIFDCMQLEIKHLHASQHSQALSLIPEESHF